MASEKQSQYRRELVALRDLYRRQLDRVERGQRRRFDKPADALRKLVADYEFYIWLNTE